MAMPLVIWEIDRLARKITEFNQEPPCILRFGKPNISETGVRERAATFICFNINGDPVTLDEMEIYTNLEDFFNTYIYFKNYYYLPRPGTMYSLLDEIIDWWWSQYHEEYLMRLRSDFLLLN
jgi:hypothetical protein